MKRKKNKNFFDLLERHQNFMIFYIGPNGQKVDQNEPKASKMIPQAPKATPKGNQKATPFYLTAPRIPPGLGRGQGIDGLID